ncbi:MAG: hypothetical protein [Caudoviricetes sp.]|nr:MAG: hypothetical protein [Caudoviricetes sp.]
MGRRSFISVTAIKRLISASNRRNEEQRKLNLINSQQGNAKELDPEFFLKKVDFNLATRITKIEIEQKQHYRTIERYITQNYVRYPIYSDWKIRTKLIKKTLKLTNAQLENLSQNDDKVISMLADQIIAALNNENLQPSWFIQKYLTEEYRADIKNLENEKKTFYNKTVEKQKHNQEIIDQINVEIENICPFLQQKIKKATKLNSKMQKIANAKKSVFLSLITLFIYNYLKSNHRKKKLSIKQNALQTNIDKLNKSIQVKKDTIYDLKQENKNLEQNYLAKKDEIEIIKQETTKIFRSKSQKIKPLPTNFSVSNDFIPLSSLCGLEYEKIIGCYIIHNKENDKYYVGQSKDVLKRLRQHFKGTIPNNIIFAEDYFSSLPENRDKLFEIKIISCQTKDELDRMEKSLIEEYDSFNNGYNNTSGNK